MSKLFEIFVDQTSLDIKTSLIDGLLSYPDVPVKTDLYRVGMQKYEGTEWSGTVDQNLVDACAGMTPEQRAIYYDDSDLKSYQWLVDNDWFAPL